MAVWGHLGPRGPSGRSPASCGGLGASGPRGPSGPLSGVLWRSGGIWVPRLEFSGQLSRKVAQGFDRGEDFRAQQAPQKTQKCPLIQTLRVCVGSPAYTRGHDKAASCPDHCAGEGAFRPFNPQKPPGRLQTFLPCLGRAMSVRFCPSISVRSGPAASLAALRASGPAMCVATLGFIA